VEKWKREEHPVIRARAAEVGATILFADEASVRTDYHAGTTWAPVGQTPVVTGSAVRHAVKIVSAIGQRGQLSFQVHEGSMNAERFIEFLEDLLHDFDTPIFLVVDGSSVHKANIVKGYVTSTQGRLELFFLPPYSPELVAGGHRRAGPAHHVHHRAGADVEHDTGNQQCSDAVE